MRSKRILFALYLLCCSTASAVYLDKRTITIDHTKVGAINNTDQTNFTVLFCANSVGNCSATISDFKTVANGGLIQNTTTCCATGLTVPADLIFTSDSLCITKLNWDIESYSATTGAIVVWVLIGTVSHTSDTVFYACYNNTLVTTYQATYTSAYDSHTRLVYHFNDGSSAAVHDSSVDGRTTVSATQTSVSGQIGNGADWASSTLPSFPATNLPKTTSQRTEETWFNLNGHTGVQQCWIAWGNTGNLSAYGHFYANTAALWVYFATSGGATIPWTVDANWHYLVSVLPVGGSTISSVLMYLDGVNLTNTPTASGTLNTIDTLGAVISQAGSSSTPFRGLLDESKISDVQRSADWINTGYKNQSNPGTFLSIGGLTLGSIHHKSTLQ